MAEVDAQAYAVTSANAAAGASNSVETQQPGGSGALRQVVALADPTTRANIAKVSSDGGLSVNGTQAAVSSTAWTSATAVNAANTINVTGYNTVSVSMTNTSTMTAGVISFEVSPDNTNWFAISMARIDSYTVETTYTLNTVANRAWSTSVDGFTQFRVRLSTVITGTGTATILVTPQTFAIEPIVSVGQSTAASLQMTVGAALPTGTNTIGAFYPAVRNTGGATMFTLISAASTNATLVKSSAATLYSITAFNNGAAVAYLKLFNLTTAPTVGTSVAVKTLMLPPGGGLTMAWPTGESFATGLSYSVTGLPATSDTTAVALNQVIVNGSYA